MSKVTDFKIPSAILREVCRLRKVPFVDIDISFESPAGKINNGILHIGEVTSIGQTLYSIVQSYLNNDTTILGKSVFSVQGEKDNFLIYVATLLRKAITGQNANQDSDEEMFLQRLYQRPLVWSLMKNLVCPLHGKNIHNLPLICGYSPQVDICRFYREGEISNETAPKGAFIFVNENVSNEAVKSALLFVEALKAHDLSPNEVVLQLFEGDLYDKMIGIAKMALLDDEKVGEFVSVVFAITGLSPSLFPHVPQSEGKIVIAQGSNIPSTVPLYWWYQGLIEKMLEPARGPDWSTRQALEGVITEFWDQVETIKSRKSIGDGVPFNDLLRLKQLQTTEPLKHNTTIQDMLSSQRIWQ